jgi:hypothetical protein
MLKEQAGGQQLQVAWTVYHTDYRDRVIAGYQHWTWAHPTTGPAAPFRMLASDPNNPTREMEGTPVKPWPWRFVSALSVPYETVVFEKDRLSAIRGTGTWDTYAFSTSPTMGMNAVYLGGHYLHGAFRPDAIPGPHPRSRGGLGAFYVEQSHQIHHADRLMVFSSAATATTTNVKTAEAHYFVLPPRPCPSGMPTSSTGRTAGWTPPNPAIDRTGRVRPPAQTNDRGYVRARHFGRAVTMMVDGHVKMQSFDDLRDMRKWSAFANDPNWNFQPR